jgi:hypothetical protein
MQHLLAPLVVCASLLLAVGCKNEGAPAAGTAPTSGAPAAAAKGKKGAGFSVAVAGAASYSFEPRKKGGYRVKVGGAELKINLYPDKVKLKEGDDKTLAQVKKKGDGGFAIEGADGTELMRARGQEPLELKGQDGQVQATWNAGALAVPGVLVEASGNSVVVKRDGAVVATLTGVSPGVAAAFAMPGLDPPAQAALAVFLHEVR